MRRAEYDELRRRVKRASDQFVYALCETLVNAFDIAEEHGFTPPYRVELTDDETLLASAISDGKNDNDTVAAVLCEFLGEMRATRWVLPPLRYPLELELSDRRGVGVVFGIRRLRREEIQ